MKQFISKNKNIIGIIGIGIFLRLVFAYLFTHVFDFLNILVMVKSVADTNNLIEGFFVIKRSMSYEVQLYGKIYYQVVAVWLHILNFLKVINVDFIFDTKPYSTSLGYMDSFLQWGPLHYQLLSIKLIQFLYDFILLFYLTKISKLLFNKKIQIGVVVFWAINPLIIYTTYVLFQSDLAMVAFLTGGIYYALLELRKPSDRAFSSQIFLMLLFFAVGAVIKQVPILLVMPALILLTKNIISFIKYCFVFALMYLVITQPWAADMSIIKNFYISSEESLALFKFGLNSVPIFMLAYLFFLVFLYKFKKEIIATPYNFLAALTIFFSILYISEDLNFLFVQFNIWILPLLAILSLKDKRFSIFILAPLIGFYKRAIIDNDVMIGSLGVSLGLPLHYVPKYNDLISQFITPSVFHAGVSTLFIFGYIALIIFCIDFIRNRSKSLENDFYSFSKYSLTSVSVLLLFVYFVITGGDYILRSKYALSTNYNVTNTSKQVVSEKPFAFLIANPESKTITGLQIKLARQEINHNEYTIFRFTDIETGKLLLEQEMNDYTLPTDDSVINIRLKSNLKSKSIKGEIFKKPTSVNNVILFVGDESIKNTAHGHFSGYDQYYKDNHLEIDFKNRPAFINLLTQYSILDIVENTKTIVQQKPSFYLMYGLGTIFFIILSVLLLWNEFLRYVRNLRP